jgi:hypothetical protein
VHYNVHQVTTGWLVHYNVHQVTTGWPMIADPTHRLTPAYAHPSIKHMFH